MDVDDNKSANQSCDKFSLKRKWDSETNGSKLLRAEGFSWWTSLLLGLEPSNSGAVQRACVDKNIIRKAKKWLSIYFVTYIKRDTESFRDVLNDFLVLCEVTIDQAIARKKVLY